MMRRAEHRGTGTLGRPLLRRARRLEGVLVLALDTATPAVTAGVVELTDDDLARRSVHVTRDARKHAELLMPGVRTACADAGIALTDVEAVVVGTGPGPFTGLRVGMVTAAALGDALGVPVHGVCSLDAIAVDAAVSDGSLLVVTDARRREVYWAAYSADGRRTDGPHVEPPGALAARVPALGAVAAAGGSAALVDLPVRRHPRPAGAALPAASRCRGAGRAEGRERAMTATVQIDALRESDAARCAELERLLFAGDDPWSERAFREELRAGHHYLAAREDDRLVGYGGIAFVAGPPLPEAEIHTIGVDPAHQGRGIGRALLRGLLAVADEAGARVFLEVRTDNDAARALYEAEGFTVVGLRRRYYRPSGADAHTMRRDAR
jgi:tRNA threonylcarbamoyl adenosine modification protein YeaZ/ribosomal-protein-alanine acetyltransferase